MCKKGIVKYLTLFYFLFVWNIVFLTYKKLSKVFESELYQLWIIWKYFIILFFLSIAISIIFDFIKNKYKIEGYNKRLLCIWFFSIFMYFSWDIWIAISVLVDIWFNH